MISHKQPVNFTLPEDKHGLQPGRGSLHAAGWDVMAAEDTVLYPYKTVRVVTNLCVEIPPEFFLAIMPRSGFSTKNQIVMTNSLGVVDADYRGEIAVPLMWTPEPISVLEIVHPMKDQYGPDGAVVGQRLDYMSPRLSYREGATFKIEKGSRIAQAVLLRYHEQDWRYVDELSKTGRGANGFGSTGV